MVARCLPVFKVSASLIMSPPTPPHLTKLLCVASHVFYFPQPSPCIHTHTPLTPRCSASLFIFGQSVTQLHFLRGLCTVWAPIGTTLAKQRAILMKSL